jgi:alpha-L-fucosidase
MTDAQDDRQVQDRKRRLAWWQEARFGMFIHWGLYAQLGRGEWARNRERIPLAEYEPLAATWKPKPRPAREWARLARDAGMKYLVMTTKHHEGFCLWDSRQTKFNAAQCGPGRDLVAEYVEACREFGLKVGFYYSLMDWRHPDGARCLKDEAARRRFLDFTQALVRELMTDYGTVDILWYDVAWPLTSAEGWESAKMNAMVRALQPDILINNRAHLPEDFGTPEENLNPESDGRAWESCMTFNGCWGYVETPAEDWLPTRRVLNMLWQVAANDGNLLLNIGPTSDGTVPPLAVERLTQVGKWLKGNGEAVFGRMTRTQNCPDFLDWANFGCWTRKGNDAYFWCTRWPGKKLAIGGFQTKLLRASLLAGGRPLKFTQEADRIVFTVPERCPDRIAQTAVLKLEFADKPVQKLGGGCEIP